MTDERHHLEELCELKIAERKQTRREMPGRSPEGDLLAIDLRIHEFLKSYLGKGDTSDEALIPAEAEVLSLTKPGMARILSLPAGKQYYKNEFVESYGLGEQGILHNPKHDRRTTKNSFHIVEGGPGVPSDKLEVPKVAFDHILQAALTPPDDLNTIPYTCSEGEDEALACMASLALKVPVVPYIEGICGPEYLECRVLAPGGLVSNLDFLEEIFGNAGNVLKLENDPGLDPENFTGVSSCIIFAPHLCTLTKKALGLPSKKDASERQMAEGMYWEREEELYNDGVPFKLVARDDKGITVTIIADNYFGYGKKTVKADLSYAANLRGLVLEEHSGGATVFARYNYGNVFVGENHLPSDVLAKKRTLDDTVKLLAPHIENNGGVYFDKEFPDVIYVPTNIQIDLSNQQVVWTHNYKTYSRELSTDEKYILPNGQLLQLVKGAVTGSWKLVTSRGRNTIFHKPCTVSGGGKSEVSKSFVDVQGSGPLVIDSFLEDVELIRTIFKNDFSMRFAHGRKTGGRSILSRERGLGSVIKLLTPSHEYTDKFNDYLHTIPTHIKQWIFHLKSVWKEEYGQDWHLQYSVEQRDGQLGRELYFHGKKIILSYARIGFKESGTIRTFSLRWDYNSAAKFSDQDDITVSAIIPNTLLQLAKKGSSQISLNVEQKLFQRPDGCINPGAEYESEVDIATSKGLFLVNFEPLDFKEARKLATDVVLLEEFTPEMRMKIKAFAERKVDDGTYLVVSSRFRRYKEGGVSMNPRYLQARRDLPNTERRQIAERCSRIYEGISAHTPLRRCIDVAIPGRRLNPPGDGYPPLTVYSPLHYQELPELIMDYVASLSGKSPSTTGAGSEGALTKGPFNALPAIYDLNDFLVASVLTGIPAYSTPTGFIGPKYRIDHDISFIAPEVFSRMTTEERQPDYLIHKGFLEKVSDYADDHGRLGYRITDHFVNRFFGRVFSEPHQIFEPDMLRPELQDADAFKAGMDNILGTGKKIAQSYIEDGTIEYAVPPLKALLSIMAEGEYRPSPRETWTSDSPAFRDLFSYETVTTSTWYTQRLSAQLQFDQEKAQDALKRLLAFKEKHQKELSDEMSETLVQRIAMTEEKLRSLKDASLNSQQGFIGRNPVVI